MTIMDYYIEEANWRVVRTPALFKKRPPKYNVRYDRGWAGGDGYWYVYDADTFATRLNLSNARIIAKAPEMLALLKDLRAAETLSNAQNARVQALIIAAEEGEQDEDNIEERNKLQREYWHNLWAAALLITPLIAVGIPIISRVYFSVLGYGSGLISWLHHLGYVGGYLCFAGLFGVAIAINALVERRQLKTRG